MNQRLRKPSETARGRKPHHDEFLILHHMKPRLAGGKTVKQAAAGGAAFGGIDPVTLKPAVVKALSEKTLIDRFNQVHALAIGEVRRSQAMAASGARLLSGRFPGVPEFMRDMPELTRGPRKSGR